MARVLAGRVLSLSPEYSSMFCDLTIYSSMFPGQNHVLVALHAGVNTPNNMPKPAEHVNRPMQNELEGNTVSWSEYLLER